MDSNNSKSRKLIGGEIKIVHLIKNTFIHSSGLIINNLLSLISKVVYLKVLGLEILGIYTFLSLMIPYYSYFFMGISYSLVRRIANLQSLNESERLAQHRSVVNIFSLFMSIMLTMIFIIYLKFIYDEQNSDFTKINLILVFVTAIITEFTTLLNSHLKSIGNFAKIHSNAALVRIFTPILSIILVYSLGLNGLLLSLLLISIFSAVDLTFFSIKQKTGVLNINYFNKSLLIKDLKLGISMLFSKKLPDMLYTVFLTYLGLSFTKETLGSFNFLATMLGITSQLLGAFYTIVERRIYLGKEFLKSNIEYLTNLSFGNSVIFGIIMQSLIIFLIIIIPLYFSELSDSIYLLPWILLIFTIRNSIKITEHYINSYNLFTSRNILSVIAISTYLVVLNIFSIDSLEHFIVVHAGILLFYKIVISLFLQRFFIKKTTILRILFGDLLMVTIICLFTFIIISYEFKIVESILLASLFSTFLFFVHTNNPKKSFKDLLVFLDKEF